jgi:hypothetical protein
MQFHYQHLDISQSLLEGVDLSSAIEAPQCDFTVCFAFMHHLPLASQRRDLLRALVEHTRPGGCIAVSFWQFLDDSRLVGKAQTFAGRDRETTCWVGRAVPTSLGSATTAKRRRLTSSWRRLPILPRKPDATAPTAERDDLIATSSWSESVTGCLVGCSFSS